MALEVKDFREKPIVDNVDLGGFKIINTPQGSMAVFNPKLSETIQKQQGYKSPYLHIWVPPVGIKYRNEKYGVYWQTRVLKACADDTNELFDYIDLIEKRIQAEVENKFTTDPNIHSILRGQKIKQGGMMNHVDLEPTEIPERTGLFLEDMVSGGPNAFSDVYTKVAVIKADKKTRAVPAYIKVRRGDYEKLDVINSTLWHSMSDLAKERYSRVEKGEVEQSDIPFNYGIDNACIGDIIRPVICLDRVLIGMNKISFGWVVRSIAPVKMKQKQDNLEGLQQLLYLPGREDDDVAMGVANTMENLGDEYPDDF